MQDSQKAAIEEAANKRFAPTTQTRENMNFGFRKGAQHVIEHPEKYGLFTKEQVLEIIRKGFSNE